MRLVAALICSAMLICFGVLPGHTEKRVALVIGNGAYQNTATLSNPAHDAEDMAATLQAVGFDVIVETNVNKRSLELAMARFGRIAQEADAALFYYAGHGIQHRGVNYLMPIDARLEDEFSVNYELTRIEDVLFALSAARGVKIVILDACRNNPLADRLLLRTLNRDVISTRGLARIEAPRGMIIAYATQSNQVAVDGTGRNSPFTSALLKEIEQPGLEIATLFRRVAANVDRVTGGRQLPELSISMSGEFYLNTRDTDVQAWAKLRGSTDQRQLRNFISLYPDSPLTSDVQERLAAFERVERAQVEQAMRAERERIEKERLARDEAERNQLEAIRLTREQAERNKAAADLKAQAEAAGNWPSSQSVLLMPPTKPIGALPKQPDVLSGSALVKAIKQELKRVGCYTGRIDDNWTNAEIKLSVGKFARYAHWPTEPSNTDSLLLDAGRGNIDAPITELFDAIRAKSDRVCPLECSVLQFEKDGRCIAKTCPAGKKLAPKGPLRNN